MSVDNFKSFDLVATKNRILPFSNKNLFFQHSYILIPPSEWEYLLLFFTAGCPQGSGVP